MEPSTQVCEERVEELHGLARKGSGDIREKSQFGGAGLRLRLVKPLTHVGEERDEELHGFGRKGCGDVREKPRLFGLDRAWKPKAHHFPVSTPEGRVLGANRTGHVRRNAKSRPASESRFSGRRRPGPGWQPHVVLARGDMGDTYLMYVKSEPRARAISIHFQLGQILVRIAF